MDNLTKIVGVRVDQQTYDRWHAIAMQRGMSVPELVRVCTDHLLNLDAAEQVAKHHVSARGN